MMIIRNPPWDENKTERAIELWKAKVSGSDIAKELGTTRNAVMGKLKRRGMMGKGAPPSRPNVSRETRPRRPRVRSDGLPPALPRDLPIPSNASQRSFNEAGPCYGLVDLQANECHWPIGDPVNEPDTFCYCAAPVAKGDYCIHHLQLMWNKGNDRTRFTRTPQR